MAPAAIRDSAPHVEEVTDMILATDGKVIEAMIIVQQCLEAPRREKILKTTLGAMTPIVDDLVVLFTSVYEKKIQEDEARRAI